MRLSEITETYLYHGTSRENLRQIAVEGLTPSPPDAQGWPEYWQDGDDDDDGDDYDDDDEKEDGDDTDRQLPEEAFEPRLFLSNVQSAAQEYADNYPDPIVLRMRIDAVDWNTTSSNDWPVYYTTETVPPEAIEVLGADKTWHKLK